MPASKEPFIATNVPSEVHERLKQRAGEHGLTLRDYCTIVLSDAVAERPSVTSPSVSERHAPLFGCSPTRQNAEYAPVKIRLRDDEAEGVPYDRLQRPPIVRDDPKLPDDPEAAAIVFARELQLVRLSSLWRQMVEEGVTEAELRSVVPD